MRSPPSHPVGSSTSRLRAEVSGRVIGPDEPAYDQARTAVYGGFDQRRPAVIIRAADDPDVQRVVALARDTGLGLAVRSGAYSPAGHSVVDGGIVLDLAEMHALDLDPEARTAWAQPGLTIDDLLAAEVVTADGQLLRVDAEHHQAVAGGPNGPTRTRKAQPARAAVDRYRSCMT